MVKRNYHESGLTNFHKKSLLHIVSVESTTLYSKNH